MHRKWFFIEMALIKISMKKPFGKFVVRLKYLNKILMKSTEQIDANELPNYLIFQGISLEITCIFNEILGKGVRKFVTANLYSAKKPFGNIHWLLEVTNECYQMALSLSLEKFPNANSMKLPIHISIGYF